MYVPIHYIYAMCLDYVLNQVFNHRLRLITFRCMLKSSQLQINWTYLIKLFQKTLLRNQQIRTQVLISVLPELKCMPYSR